MNSEPSNVGIVNECVHIAKFRHKVHKMSQSAYALPALVLFPNKSCSDAAIV